MSLVVFCPFIWFRVVLGRPGRFRIFGVALVCPWFWLGRFSSLVCIWLFAFVILIFIVFINFKKYVVFVMCFAFFLEVLSLFYIVFAEFLVASTSVDSFTILKLFQIVQN